MNTIGFVINSKENERRRAILPSDLKKIANKNMLYFEKGYGEVMGFPDEVYLNEGVHVVNKEEAYAQEIICTPKTPEIEEQKCFSEKQILFGWIHAVQGKSITDFLINKRMTAIAWEDMFEDGLHIFWRNNEIAGEAAILHSINYLGKLPCDCTAAIIGRGNCARGAFRILCQLGAKVTVYDRNTARKIRSELRNFDIVVNAVLWDVFRGDHLINIDDLCNMKPGSMIVDISCDPNMGIESSKATTIENPIYEVDGIIHYAVDHTPTLFYKTASEFISSVVWKYVDDLVLERKNVTLENATCIKDGIILNDMITRFQKRK